ncbi:MAG TPA: tetratricopeptide repeat protein [Candidatus Dormibacteraeota bacterium]|nr:tetratricopeptide repeat protein [Candidatus Dormibacteraeota bacterium]
MRVVRMLTLCYWSMLCLAIPAWPQTQTSTTEIREAARTAIQQKRYVEAISLLEEGRKKYPNDLSLKIELGRAYLYDRQDGEAIKLFREILHEDGSNRIAKLELARALGYNREYKPSDDLYRQLLASDPSDEAASAGLIRNLLHEKRAAEARDVYQQARAHHPDSTRLDEYRVLFEKNGANDRFSQSRDREPRRAGVRKSGRVQVSSAFFSDSARRRFWRFSQDFEGQITNRLGARLLAEERVLWNSAGPKANVNWFTGEVRAQITRGVLLSGGGGTVRFPDGSGRGLFSAGAELHPANRLWISGGFKRRPIAPTYQSSLFDLAATGWNARLEWDPKAWRLRSSWSREHYSDSNRSQRFDADLLHWTGQSQFAVGLGYRFTYLAFDQSLRHGYFSPSRYYDHLGQGGVKFQLGRRFRAEYLGGVGVESISGRPYHLAWELALRNAARFGNWEVGADYFYYHLAQDTGAFRSQALRGRLAYYF